MSWWRRRELNPRPQALRFKVYMLISSLISLQVTRRTRKANSQFSKVLTLGPQTYPYAILFTLHRDLNVQTHIRPMTLKLVFKQLVRSCRRLQLKGLQLYLRGNLCLGMHSKFRYPRRSHVAPVFVETRVYRTSVWPQRANTMKPCSFCRLIWFIFE